LHFGLLSIGDSLPVNYGGAGLMLAHPRTMVAVAARERFQLEVKAQGSVWPDSETRSPLTAPPSRDDSVTPVTAATTTAWAMAARVRSLAGVWLEAFGSAAGLDVASIDELPVGIQLLDAPPAHMGLGSGTQLALSVGAALCRHFGLELPGPHELAVGMGRGRRSAIGSYGFFRGGFLVDRGLGREERFAELALQLDFPADWPVLLILPKLPGGSHAEAERDLFAVATGSAEVRSRLERMLNDQLVPALLARDHAAFAVGLHEFNTTSGLHYPAAQAGEFHSPEVARIVAAVHDAGAPGVLQSSWGPGVAVILPDRDAALALQSHLAEAGEPALQGAGLILTAADNRGAKVQCDAA
jgi:beta-RFAP synthase